MTAYYDICPSAIWRGCGKKVQILYTLFHITVLEHEIKWGYGIFENYR
jgi:hypothetical protein